MSLRKNPTLYTATFENLKLNAFGFDQVIRESFAITVHQVTCKPERWAARPKLAHRGHQWEAGTAEAVMELVAADFEKQLTVWAPMPEPKEATPSLRSGADIPGDRRRA